MNKFSIDIQGIHCSGCVNLIKMTFEDLQFSNTEVDMENNKINFESSEDANNTKSKLDAAFNNDLTNYKYSNLVLL